MYQTGDWNVGYCAQITKFEIDVGYLIDKESMKNIGMMTKQKQNFTSVLPLLFYGHIRHIKPSPEHHVFLNICLWETQRGQRMPISICLIICSCKSTVRWLSLHFGDFQATKPHFIFSSEWIKLSVNPSLYYVTYFDTCVFKGKQWVEYNIHIGNKLKLLLREITR